MDSCAIVDQLNYYADADEPPEAANSYVCLLYMIGSGRPSILRDIATNHQDFLTLSSTKDVLKPYYLCDICSLALQDSRLFVLAKRELETYWSFPKQESTEHSEPELESGSASRFFGGNFDPRSFEPQRKHYLSAAAL